MDKEAWESGEYLKSNINYICIFTTDPWLAQGARYPADANVGGCTMLRVTLTNTHMATI